MGRSLIHRKRMVLIGVSLGLLSWLLESAIHSLVLKQGPYINQVFTTDLHELCMRTAIFLLLVAFGAYAQCAMDKRRETEDQVKLAYAELEQIFNTAADGMRVIDRDFNVLRVNDTFSEMSGVSRENSIGRKCYQVFQGPECHTPQCPLVQIMRGEEKVERRVDKERADGTKIPCILTAVPFKGLDGTLLGVVENFKDISSWIQAQEEKDALQRRLEEALTKALSGFLPICASCKKIRDDQGKWVQIENYIKGHTEAVLSHSICPECMEKLYPDLEQDK